MRTTGPPVGSDQDPADQPAETERLVELAHQMFDWARAGDTERVDAYVEAGVPVNLTDASGNTLLMLAAYHGHATTVTVLAGRGADVDRLNDRGQSPLAGAVFKDEQEVVRALLDAGRRPRRRQPHRPRDRGDVRPARAVRREDPSRDPGSGEPPDGTTRSRERLHHMTLTDARTPSTAPAPGAAQEMADVVRPLFGGELPVRLRAWDGSVAGPEGAPTVVINDAAALRRLVYRPGELGLAQAYVLGEIDVEGDLLDGFRRVWQAVREQGASPRLNLATVLAGAPHREEPRRLRAAPRAAGVAGPAPRPAALADPRPGRDLAPLRPLQRLLLADPRPAHGVLLRLLHQGPRRPGVHRRGRAARQARPGLPQARPRPGEPGHRHLDIGCGWGSLSLFAAEQYGVQVIGVTIAAEQKAFIDQRIAERGLQDRVEIRLQDYRDVPDGPFDTISSIEMGEHVGEKNYPVYTAGIHRLLRPGGRALIQQMSRTTRPGGGPFIEAFIAPDMHMRPVGETVDLIEEAGLEVRDVHALREHYVWTVDAWYATFEANWDQVVELVGEEVGRVWRLYLVGGALAFEEGRMGVDQILMVKPTPDGRSSLPRVRTA